MEREEIDIGGEEIFIKPDMRIEEKPKKKRQLTEKQLEGLAKGRAKAKANRDKKKKEEEKQKKYDSQKLKQEQREVKKKKKAEQKETKESIALRKVRENSKVKKFEDLKYQQLSKLDNEDTFKTMNAYLNTLSKEDIIDDKRLNKKLSNMVEYLEKKKNKK